MVYGIYNELVPGANLNQHSHHIVGAGYIFYNVNLAPSQALSKSSTIWGSESANTRTSLRDSCGCRQLNRGKRTKQRNQQRKQRLTDVERNRMVPINIPWNIYKRYTKILRNTKIYIYRIMNYMVYPINIPLNHYKNPIKIVPNKNHTITKHAIDLDLNRLSRPGPWPCSDPVTTAVTKEALVMDQNWTLFWGKWMYLWGILKLYSSYSLTMLNYRYIMVYLDFTPSFGVEQGR